MPTEEIIAILKNMLTKQLGSKIKEIHLTHALVDDLGADSIDVMEIITDSEINFGITIEDGEYEHCKTVQDIVNLIEKKLKDK
jgi:acyl carrier protein